MTYRYRAFGLAVEADFPIPELTLDHIGGAPDLHVGTATLLRRGDSYQVEVDGPVTTIWVPDANAVFQMVEGRRLAVNAPGAEIGRNVRLYLLGSALGAILHQRGLLPLHACVLDFGGKAVAFLGHSGAGKSTLAAWLAERGGRLLSDDVCVVRQEVEGRFSAAVGIPRRACGAMPLKLAAALLRSCRGASTIGTNMTFRLLPSTELTKWSSRPYSSLRKESGLASCRWAEPRPCNA